MHVSYVLNAKQSDSNLYQMRMESVPTFLDAKLANSDKTIKKVSFNAYNGGAVSLNSLFYPVVFDLATLKKSDNVPLLFNHDLDAIVGHSTDINVNSIKGITGDGLISGTGDRAKEVIDNANNGFPWQMSVGIRGDKLLFYGSDETFTANGQTFSGPKYLARDALLREISFVPAGADDKTSANIKASLHYEGKTVNKFDEWLASLGYNPSDMDANLKANLKKQYDEKMDLQAKLDTVNKAKVEEKKEDKKEEPNPVVDLQASLRKAAAEEIEYINLIKELDAKYENPKDDKGNSLLKAALDSKWTVEKTHLEMLKAHRPANIGFAGGGSSQEKMEPLVLEAALAQAGNISNLDKKFPEKILDAAHKRYHSRIGLQEFLLEAAYMGGYDKRTFKIHDGNMRDILKATFSTSSIPGILSNNANKHLVEGFRGVDDSWRKLAMITSRPDFKEATGYRGVGSFTMEPLGPAGEIPHGTMSEASYTNKVKTVARMFATTREEIKNDDLNALNGIPRGIGRGGALALVKAFWTEWLSGVGSFWASGHINVSTGVLGIAGLNALNGVFKKQVDENADYVLARLAYLVVPSELEPQANTLVSSAKIVTGLTTADGVPEDNPWAGKLQVVSSPYLSDAAISGNSSVAYYGCADPRDIPTIEVAFLDGVETPTIESAEADFNVLGIQWRGWYDFGVKLQEYRGSVRSTGA